MEEVNKEKDQTQEAPTTLWKEIKKVLIFLNETVDKRELALCIAILTYTIWAVIKS